MAAEHLDSASSIRVPAELAGSMAPVGSFRPNAWNPNKMDSFMRDKLVKSIQADGFIVPLLVRPDATGLNTWEIVDGEHRWLVASKDLGMAQIPFVNVGPISDRQAQALTIRANQLRGEFDAVELSSLVNEIVQELGRDQAINLLPFTDQRIDAMIDLAMAEMDVSAQALADSIAAAETGVGGGGSDRDADEFKSFDPDKTKFAHECPRCKFQFN